MIINGKDLNVNLSYKYSEEEKAELEEKRKYDLCFISHLKKDKKQLQQRIDNAIEYIKHYVEDYAQPIQDKDIIEIYYGKVKELLEILGDKQFYTCELCKEEKEDVIPRNNPYMYKVNDEILKQYLCKDCYEKLCDNIYEE